MALVAGLMLEVEAEMRHVGLWGEASPSNDALSSVLPFCCDTLSFAEWLQYVFLPRMKVLLEAGANLPGKCGLVPMAEESFRFLGPNAAKILSLLRQVDEALTQRAGETSLQ